MTTKKAATKPKRTPPNQRFLDANEYRHDPATCKCGKCYHVRKRDAAIAEKASRA